uniref:Helicase C-terminal domain-containing protein n=1 Tax=Denticeps clupeoides TaxID=299321 RepID=A0AAY4BQV8_9TELE
SFPTDSEDLFGDYDSILGDSSFLAKLDDVETSIRKQEDLGSAPHHSSDTRRSAKLNESCRENNELTDSLLTDCLNHDLLIHLPSSQLVLQQGVSDNCSPAHVETTSTPVVINSKRISNTEKDRPASKVRKSITDQLKQAMLNNASAVGTISKKDFQKEAVVTKEIGIALQAENSFNSETDLGPFFGLPSKVKDLIKKLKSIDDLYDWQKICLNLESVQQRKNLIYSLPTSGGKTLVAEILILKELLCRKKDALLILPYISLVQEKLHMLGEGSRGAILEMTLAKVLYISKETQIIGMSATLNNIGDLQIFLKADNYTNDFRPVQLKEYVKLKDTIYEVDPKEEECFKFSRLLNFKYSGSLQKMDPDHIVALVTEVIPVHSCLVFCATKKNCENVAGMICKYLARDFLRHKEEEKSMLLAALRSSGNGIICPVLQKTVPYGVAYHHSGLTSDERKLVEEAYTSQTLCLLACTSTLAAGINLPARRVILRSPYVATDFLKRSQYKQMVGRAGRAGIDSMGESILILQEKDKLSNLVCAPMENCYSNLMHGEGRGLLSLILSLVGLNITLTLEKMREFLSGTLLGVQEAHVSPDRSLVVLVEQSVEILRKEGLISSSTDGQVSAILHITKLGRATYKGSVDLTYSNVLYRDLSKGLEGLLLNSFLHLVYLVTPYDMVPHCKPDWMIYYTQFAMLSSAEQKMLAALGVPESFLARKAAGQSVKKAWDLEVASRLYLALVLYSLLKETDLWRVSERFQLTRGFVQTLLSSSSAFCSCVLHFTEEMEELWPFKALLAELTRRLTYCVQAELIPLMEVAGVMEARAKQLYNAGYRTLTHLANADPSLLAKTVENLFKGQANQIVASAKMLLQEKAEALQEEVDDLLTKPADLPT